MTVQVDAPSVVRGSEPALVDTAWLARHLTDDDVVVFQVDLDSSSYYAGHVPGSLALDWYDELHEHVRRGPVSREHFEELMRRKGVSEDHHVVLVAGTEISYAAHAYWLFRYYRHRRVSLLDGACRGWIAAGLQLEDTDPPARPETSYRSPGTDGSLRVDRDEVLQRYVGAPGSTLILDCRTPAEYEGRSRNPTDLPVERHRVGGHIPGAENLPSTLLLQDPTQFHELPRLQEVFASRGLAPDSEVVVYCRAAERSSLEWFALHELLGHRPVRHYDGGWSEYGSLMDVPVERDDDD